MNSEQELTAAMAADIEATPAPEVDPNDRRQIIAIDAGLLVNKINQSGLENAAETGAKIDALVQALIGRTGPTSRPV